MLSRIVEQIADNPVAHRGAARPEHHDALLELLYPVEDEAVDDSELTGLLVSFCVDYGERTVLRPLVLGGPLRSNALLLLGVRIVGAGMP